jgi:UDP-N-acetylmuramoyl-L-alanyl-D-glutamate--2,6-diaminopimelate ligase
MEVSSHGLVQDRVAGVEFDVALLTNLTRDHLDYHRTMRNYRAAKARLFRFESLKYAVLNLDDAFGAELVAKTQRRGVQALGYGFNRARPAAIRGCRVARVMGRNLRMSADGMSFDVATPWGKSSVESRLIGRFNAANLLGTLAVLLASDCALDDSVAALGKVAAVPGRTERFGGGRQPLVVVDYAHTPDALENVLRTLRELTHSTRGQRGRLICVFGCGGDRDRGKRPLMGRLAAELADDVTITSDNPRGEKPEAIVAEILEGVTRPCEIVIDRADAIDAAVRNAKPGDVVLIAGKGHEQYQEIGGIRHPFSDAAQVRAALGRGTP